MIPRFPSKELALEYLRKDVQGHSSSILGGGYINQSSRLKFSDGTSCFLKENRGSQFIMFLTEAEGLLELKRVGAPSVPSPLALIEGKEKSGLILEYIPSCSPNTGFWEKFGRSLAQLHQSGGSSRYGWSRDNFIGSTPQKNTESSSWIDFFREERLLFQGRLAFKQAGLPGSLLKQLEGLCDKLDTLLFEPEQPQPLHGDLWSGNFLCGSQVEPWIFDPAFYFGCGEADLAMTEMFGGYAPAFYGAYKELISLPAGYEERKDIYNLYHYLNHLNLFGGSYLSPVRSIIQRYS